MRANPPADVAYTPEAPAPAARPGLVQGATRWLSSGGMAGRCDPGPLSGRARGGPFEPSVYRHQVVAQHHRQEDSTAGLHRNGYKSESRTIA